MNEKRVAVVTGASSGIGQAITRQLATKGLRVLACGRQRSRLDQLVRSLADAPGDVVQNSADVRAPGAAEDMIATAERLWGATDIFVACAGLGLPGSVLTSDPERWREAIEVNYLAVLTQLRAFGSEFVKYGEKEGNTITRDIIVIGSTVGREVSSANPVYGSTKFAIHSITEAARRELCEHNIRVTLIEPGFVRSAFQESAGYDMDWFASATSDYEPLLCPSDIASVVDFVVDQPGHVHVDNIRVRPTRQKI